MADGAEYGDNLFETYIDMMRTRVFDPIGMSTATFSIEETEANPNHATPHYSNPNGTLVETGFGVAPTHYWDTAALAPARWLHEAQDHQLIDLNAEHIDRAIEWLEELRECWDKEVVECGPDKSASNTAGDDA